MKHTEGGFRAAAGKVLDRMIGAIRNFKIYYRLVIAFFALIIFPSAIIGYSSYSIASGEIKKNTSNYTYQYISNINANTDQKLRKYEDITSDIYNNPNVYDLLKKCQDLQLNKKYLPNSDVEYPDDKKQLDDLLYNASGYDKNILNIEIVTYWDEFTQISRSGVLKGGKINQITNFRDSHYYRKALDSPGDLVWYDS